MTPELIIGIVSAIFGVIFVKIWLYKVFKYKMDEGVILEFFNNCDKKPQDVEIIAKATELSETRVEVICQKSKLFESGLSKNSWLLTQSK